MYLLYSLKCRHPGDGDTDEQLALGAERSAGAGAGLSGLPRLGCGREPAPPDREPQSPGSAGQGSRCVRRSQGVLPGGGGGGCGVFPARSLDGGHQSRDDWGREHLQGRRRAGRRPRGAGRLPSGHGRTFRTQAGQGTSPQAGSGCRTVRGPECPSQEGRPQSPDKASGRRPTPAPVGRPRRARNGIGEWGCCEPGPGIRLYRLYLNWSYLVIRTE